MAIWSAELKELERLYESFRGQLPDMEKELGQLIKAEDANVILLYSRRCLEVIITDLCECELKRHRKTEPLNGIIDKLHKEEKVPAHIISSMHGLNEVSTFGTHPKDFDPEQVKPVLNNLDIIIKWHLKYKDLQIAGKEAEAKSESKQPTISHPEKSIIVLPFENISPNPDQEYFSDGLTEEIITDLSNVRELLVISRSSAMTFKGTTQTIPQIARAVNVRYVLEGSVRIAGNNLRITAQLIDSNTDLHLWADKFSGTLNDIFDIQENVSRSIVAALKLKLTGYEDQQIAKRFTENIEANILYIKGKHLHYSLTIEGMKESVKCFEKALEIDTDYALAYSGLADVYYELPWWGIVTTKEAISKAKTYLKKALDLDEKIPEIHSARGRIIAIYDWNWKEAEQEFERALELNPNSFVVLIDYTIFLTCIGKHKESIIEAIRARQLDPLSVSMNSQVGETLYMAGEFDRAINESEITISMDPNNYYPHYLMGRAYKGKQMFEEAIAEYKRALELSEGNLVVIPFLATLYYLTGSRAEGDNLLNNLLERSKKETVPSYVFFMIYKARGELDKAFVYLEKSCEDSTFILSYLAIFPDKDYRVPYDEKSTELLKRVGLIK